MEVLYGEKILEKGVYQFNRNQQKSQFHVIINISKSSSIKCVIVYLTAFIAHCCFSVEKNVHIPVLKRASRLSQEGKRLRAHTATHNSTSAFIVHRCDFSKVYMQTILIKLIAMPLAICCGGHFKVNDTQTHFLLPASDRIVQKYHAMRLQCI